MAKGKQFSDQPYGDRPSFRVMWRDNHGNILLAVATLILIAGVVVLLIPEKKTRNRTISKPAAWWNEPSPNMPNDDSGIAEEEFNAADNDAENPGATEAGDALPGAAEDSQSGTSTDTAVLRIVVEGFDSDRGVVRFALYHDQESFNNPDQAAEKANLTIEDGQVVWDVGVPVGKPVAICVFHDKNEDGKLNKSLFGIPVESYGFSLGTRSPRGPPPFAEAAFKPEPGITEVPIQIW